MRRLISSSTLVIAALVLALVAVIPRGRFEGAGE